MRHRLIALVAAATSAAISAADAQSITVPANQLAGFRAIILTPAGSLPAIVRAQRTMASSSRAEVALRFGRYSLRDFQAINNIGVTGLVHFARRFQAGGTFGYRSCASCEGLTMGSLEFGANLLHKGASGDIGGDTDLGLQVSAGMGKAKSSDVSARSLIFSVPFAVTLPQAENSILTLFLSPSLGYGRLQENGVTDGASRFMIGAGMGYTFPFGLGAHASAHRVIIEDSPTQFGFALSWLFGTS